MCIRDSSCLGACFDHPPPLGAAPIHLAAIVLLRPHDRLLRAANDHSGAMEAVRADSALKATVSDASNLAGAHNLTHARCRATSAEPLLPHP